MSETEALPPPDDPGNERKVHTLRVSNGILDHYPRMGEAIWLFLWAIDKTTREEGQAIRVGIVLGGRSVSDSEIADKFQCSTKTVRRWRNLLVREGYIEVMRTGRGCSYKVLNSKKWARSATRTAIRTLRARANAVAG